MRIPVLLFSLMLLAFPALIARSETTTQTVLESRDGTFEIQEVQPQDQDHDSTTFVVSKANPDKKQLLMTEPSFWGNDWYCSPDSKWLAVAIREVHKVSSMRLFRRTEGFEFDQIKDFAHRAWASISTKRKYTRGEEGIIDFVNWSPDSTRLLIALRGPVHGDEDDKLWFVAWSVYFNVQTQKFEYTRYLDHWDAGVFKSVSADDYADRMALAPVSAEPLFDTVSEEEWKQRQTDADRALNETYRQALAKLGSEDAATIRSQQIVWIKNRDKIADEFAKQGTPPNPTLRRLQSLVDATNARTADLKRDSLSD